MKKFQESELIINPDGSIYHLNLLPQDIADTIILVGDPGRVKIVSSFFDEIEVEKSKREFYTCTGKYNNKRITVLSTGIGTDNIDIVINELDALVNIDFETRTEKSKKKSLRIIRLGTSGGLQEYLGVNTMLLSTRSIGFDGMLNFYADRNKVANTDIEENFKSFVNWSPLLASPYVVDGSAELINLLEEECNKGITISAPGFYGPQGRELRLPVHDNLLNDKITEFRYNSEKICNYEMESSALYGLSALLGHRAACICVIIANRVSKQFTKDYAPAVNNMIEYTLKKLTSNP